MYMFREDYLYMPRSIDTTVSFFRVHAERKKMSGLKGLTI